MFIIHLTGKHDGYRNCKNSLRIFICRWSRISLALAVLRITPPWAKPRCIARALPVLFITFWIALSTAMLTTCAVHTNWQRATTSSQVVSCGPAYRTLIASTIREFLCKFVTRLALSEPRFYSGFFQWYFADCDSPISTVAYQHPNKWTSPHTTGILGQCDNFAGVYWRLHYLIRKYSRGPRWLHGMADGVSSICQYFFPLSSPSLLTVIVHN